MVCKDFQPPSLLTVISSIPSAKAAVAPVARILWLDIYLIGYALGAIASYSAAKEVPYARVIFCDADVYDVGYISPEAIAGRIEVKGRRGTRLQPGVDMLMQAKDFPKDAPILLITDGMIEDDLVVRREHAYLLPRGCRLPFRVKGDVFYYER